LLVNRDSDTYRQLIENLPDAFAYQRIVTDDRGRPVDCIFQEVNPAFEEMTGLKQEEIAGKKVSAVLPGIEKSNFDWIGTCGKVALSGETVRFEQFIEPLGRWYEVCAYSNEPGYFAAVFRDLSAEKEKALKLKRSEKGYKHIANNIPDMVVRFDTDLKHVYLNRAAEKFIGPPAEFIMGKTFLDLAEISTSEEQRKQFQRMNQILKKCFDSGKEQQDIYTFMLPEGEKHLFTRIVPEKEKGGKIVSLLAVTTDITERKQAEEKLKENESGFQRMLKVIPDMISVQDTDMNIIYSNWSGFAAVPPEKQVLNTKCYKTYRDYDQVCPDCRAIQVFDSKEVFQKEVELSEDYWVDLRVIPIIDHSGEVEYFVEWVRDISNLKAIEEELKELNINLERKVEERTAQLEAANRELDAFTHSASHDLRGPLNRITGFSKILLEDYTGQLDQQGRDYLQRINNSCEHMGELIEDLLKLSRISQMQINREPVELSALVNVCLKNLQASKPDRPVEVVITPGLVADGDTALLRIALDNLLGNAWKFTAGEDKPRIEFGSTVQEGQEAYYIKDNGTGFDMNHAEKLFTAFKRLHDAKIYSGTGVGLSIVYRIISRHGGEIWAEGKEGKGACFYFTLP